MLKRQRKIVLIGCLAGLILLLGAACQSESKPLQNSIIPEIKDSKPTIVAEGTVVINGIKQSISIRMKDGKEIYDSDPGAFQGTFLFGSFEVVATDPAGKELAKLGLNDVFDGGEMNFRKELPFEIQFDDYNEDGESDFTVGQWGGSNGNFYSMLTISSSGFEVLEENIYSADHRPSIRYRKIAGKAFLNKYYDQIIGADMDVIHRWKDGAFHRDIPTKSIEGGAAGVEGES
ncbi:hypothetical protein EHS13_31380 [Paenibacillus psychroresistens]|uniref:Uncharacterized protein n=1 Tax=Paenibacillus psychroresistens TaxID=1778678 RepID=A0A6B8RRP1_9BACL|nr:hypothetical protein [Paenibacillus psychroresistens]QGQ99061.1 hypothetical protein EHS13_31380 [Paenibacillus psychroresistens]